MFTGIIKNIATLHTIQREKNSLYYAIQCPDSLLKGLEVGSSVAVDGICQTVDSIEGNRVWFYAMEESIKRTTLGWMKEGDRVNIERSARIGDEVGGHLLSGHIYGTATLIHFNQTCYTFSCPTEWIRFLLPKGSIAIDGVSLTLSDVDPQKGMFTIHLIPITLKSTTLGEKKEGDRVNVEIDPVIQATVSTLERTLLLQRR
ncbi:MAG: riboflavin synthase subunit alpha [Chlamydiales bacterium]